MRGFLIAACLMVMLVACGYQEGIVQKSDKGYLKFSGKTENVSVKIDGAEPFSLKDGDVVYKLTPGKHTVTVSRNGQVVIDRVLIIDNQVTKEVEIP